MGAFTVVTVLSGYLYPGIDNVAHIGGLLVDFLAGGVLIISSRALFKGISKIQQIYLSGV